jgi:hypothetical protein
VRQKYSNLQGFKGTGVFGKRIPKIMYQHSSMLLPGHFLLSAFTCSSVSFSG